MSLFNTKDFDRWNYFHTNSRKKIKTVICFFFTSEENCLLKKSALPTPNQILTDTEEYPHVSYFFMKLYVVGTHYKWLALFFFLCMLSVQEYPQHIFSRRKKKYKSQHAKRALLQFADITQAQISLCISGENAQIRLHGSTCWSRPMLAFLVYYTSYV